MLLTDRLLHTPEGFRDIYNDECLDESAAIEKIMSVFHLSGFENVRTPGLEYFEVFSKERGSVPGNQMYRYFDADGNTLALRPDITPAIARLTARYFNEEAGTLRFCYSEETYRNTPGHRGQMKEVIQTGVELIGDGSVLADAEVIAVAVKSLLAVGMKDFKVEIGSAAFLNSLIVRLSLTDEEVIELYHLIDNKNRFALKALLAEKSDQIPEDIRNILSDITEDFGSLGEILKKSKLKDILAKTDLKKTEKALERLIQLERLLEMYEVIDYVSFDLGMVGKLGYYTGIILRGYTYGSGKAILSGGRYDNLVSQFGKNAPAVGMSIDMDELMSSLSKNGIHPHTAKKMVHISVPRKKIGEAIKKREEYFNQNIASVIEIDDAIADVEIREGEN